MKFKKNEDQSVDTLPLLRIGKKTPMEGVTETMFGAETEGMTTQRLPCLGIHPINNHQTQTLLRMPTIACNPACLGCTLVQPLWISFWQFSRKLDIILPEEPAIPLLGIYPDVPTYNKDTCFTMFIAALFLIARSWKEPSSPSTDEWIQKLWFTMEYCSAIKTNEFMKFLGKSMDLEDTILSEATRSQKNTPDMCSLISGQ